MTNFCILVLASGGDTDLQAILVELHGRGESRWSASARTRRRRRRAAEVESGVFALADFGDRPARDGGGLLS